MSSSMSWAGPEDVYLSTSLASYLDRKILVLLRDGRKLLGILRSFDQFANAVIESGCERIIVGDLYCDIPLGLYVIRGENVVLLGELDPLKKELPPTMTLVSEPEIRRVSSTFILFVCASLCLWLSAEIYFYLSESRLMSFVFRLFPRSRRYNLVK
ncbi:hypothetical protein ACS0TY_012674 [Phlomoides rotata]